MSGNRLLITGATGHLGAAVAQAAAAQGWSLVMLCRRPDRLSPQWEQDTRARILVADLARRSSLESVAEELRTCDVLLHLGAFVPHNAGDSRDARRPLDVNVTGTVNLLEVLGGRLPRIIYGSTVEVYGMPQSNPIDEGHRTRPLSMYGVSKLAAEGVCEVYAAKQGLTLTVLRYASIFGPGETIQRAIPNFMTAVQQGRAPVVHGTGASLRDFIYIDDAVRASLVALEAECSGVFNIASGQGTSIADLARLVCVLGSAGLEPVFEGEDDGRTDYVFDVSAAAVQLAFSAQTGLQAGLQRQFDTLDHQDR